MVRVPPPRLLGLKYQVELPRAVARPSSAFPVRQKAESSQNREVWLLLVAWRQMRSEVTLHTCKTRSPVYWSLKLDLESENQTACSDTWSLVFGGICCIHRSLSRWDWLFVAWGFWARTLGSNSLTHTWVKHLWFIDTQVTWGPLAYFT